MVQRASDLGSPLSRRAFNARLAAIGLAAVALPVGARRASAAEDLTYFTWSGYDIPELHQSYVEKHGAMPATAIFADEEEAFQKLQGGFTADVAHPCSYALPRWREAGLLAPIDVTRLPEWPNVFDRLKSVDGAVADGQNWFVPIEWGRNLILYRTDLVTLSPEQQSWSVLFDESLKGKIAMFDGVEQAVFAAALVLGFNNPFDLNDEQLTAVKELLLKQKALLRFYWTDQTNVEQALASGEVAVALAWGASYVTLKSQGVPIAALAPKEGEQTYVCGLVRLKYSQAPDDVVYDFINSELAPETGKYFIEQFNYAHANRRAFDLVDKAKLAELDLSHPDDIFNNSVFLSSIATEELRQKYNKVFEDVKLGS